jgi:hypothetical protein
MNLKQFADLAGVTVEPCGPGWGGRWGYKTPDAPNCMTCGFKTKQEARTRWISDTFGEHVSLAVLQLLGVGSSGEVSP